MSMQGVMIQMVSHAFSSGAMFLGIGWLADRRADHSRLIKSYGGVANTMPLFAAGFMVFALANVGLPGTSGFVGEFMVITSAMRTHFWVALVAASTLILGATYTLWLYKRVFFGAVTDDEVAKFKDLNWLELSNYLLLAAAVFWLGLYPQSLIRVMQVTLAHLLNQSIPLELAANTLTPFSYLT
jgi:NADH-quinone oxidoreductase subunit M